jgi:hypothetical protein
MRWMKINDARKYCGGLGARLLYDAVRSGSLKVARVGAGRNLRFSDVWCDEWLAQCAAKSYAPPDSAKFESQRREPVQRAEGALGERALKAAEKRASRRPERTPGYVSLSGDMARPMKTAMAPTGPTCQQEFPFGGEGLHVAAMPISPADQLPAFMDVIAIIEAGIRCVARRPDAESDAARTAGLDRAARWLRAQAERCDESKRG